MLDRWQQLEDRAEERKSVCHGNHCVARGRNVEESEHETYRD